MSETIIAVVAAVTSMVAAGVCCLARLKQDPDYVPRPRKKEDNDVNLWNFPW